MPAERLSMRKVREVLRLRHVLKLSYRKISDATGIGKTQVAEYVRRAEAADLGWPLPDGLDDTGLEQCLFPVVIEGRPRPAIDWPAIEQELAKRGVTLLLLWQEYMAAHPDGYSYTRFCELHKRWRGQLAHAQPSLPLETIPSEGHHVRHSTVHGSPVDEILRLARDDTRIGVVLLRGANPQHDGKFAFCAGGDQKIRGDKKGGYMGKDGVPRLNVLDLQRLIRSMPKVVIALVAGFLEPLRCAGSIFLNPKTHVIDDAKFGFCNRVALECSLLIPGPCLGIILRHPKTPHVKIAKVHGGIGVSSERRFLELPVGGRPILLGCGVQPLRKIRPNHGGR